MEKKKFLGYTLLNSHPTTDLYMIRLMIYTKPAIFHSVLITKQCIINTTRNRERYVLSNQTPLNRTVVGVVVNLCWPFGQKKKKKKQFGKEEYFNELLVVKLHNKHQICVVTFVGKFLPSLTKLTIKTSKAEILLSSHDF